jgi:hypothetical protein
MTTVPIACTTGVNAFLFGRLSGHDGTRGKIGVARTECSNTQRWKRCEDDGEDGKQLFAPFHGSTPFSSKHGHSAHVPRAAKLPLNRQSMIYRQLATEIGRVPPAEAGTVNVSSVQ